MRKTVLAFMSQHHMTEGVKKVVIGVSGGPDSMALVYFMAKEFPDLELIAAHVNHGIRKEAGEDESLVVDFCRKLGLKTELCHIDVPALALDAKLGLEETGRRERYAFFRSLNPDLIMTAHHIDDDAESIMLHFIRGCGLKGICGIEPLQNGIARPFLPVSKSELVKYCEENEIPYALDKTNTDTDYTRNRIRCEVLPELKKINPNIIETVSRFGTITAADYDFLNRTAADRYEEICVKKEEGVYILAKVLLKEHPALSRRIVRMACVELGVDIDYDKTVRILALTTGKWLPLTTGIRVQRSREYFMFIKEIKEHN